MEVFVKYRKRTMSGLSREARPAVGERVCEVTQLAVSYILEA